ncbi:MAG: substrate-binding domain-containing protein [Candidatus Methylacidiphilales bacterium]|nr:substrate-binding domain-containing protein [Candidatus Methylacidiphilales bacterium]
MSQSLLKPIVGRHKQPEVVKALIQLARHLGPNARLPRVREISKSLRVTVVTLDQALRQLEERGLIDRRPRSGIFVSPRILQRAIGLVLGGDVFSSKDTSFFAILLEQCARRAEKHNERFSFFLDSPSLNRGSSDSMMHQDLIDAIGAGKLDGLLVASSQGQEQENWLRSQGLPLASLSASEAPGTVALDGKELIRMGVAELKRQGCKRLALVGVLPGDAQVFRDAVAAEDLQLHEPWVNCKKGWGLKYDSEGATYTKSILETLDSEGASADGLLVTNDVMARGVCTAIESRGLVIGRDIKVITHANKGSLLLSQWQNALTLCEYDPAEIAEAMFEILEAMIDGQQPDKVRKVNPHLIPAGGTAA